MADIDLSARLKVGDVIVNPRGERMVVHGWTLRGKLKMRRASGSIKAAWWTYRTDLPKGYKLVRGGTEIHR